MNALVCLNLGCVSETECEFWFCYSDTALRLVRNSIVLCFSVFGLIWKCWLTFVKASHSSLQQPHLFSIFLCLSQGCSVVSARSCQWWTTAGPALTLAGIHETAFLLTETSSTECWVLLSLIVSRTFFFFYPSSLNYTPQRLDLVGLCLNQWALTEKNKWEWTCANRTRDAPVAKSRAQHRDWTFLWYAEWKR